jgi:hypothetical protein
VHALVIHVAQQFPELFLDAPSPTGRPLTGKRGSRVAAGISGRSLSVHIHHDIDPYAVAMSFM